MPNGLYDRAMTEYGLQGKAGMGALGVPGSRPLALSSRTPPRCPPASVSWCCVCLDGLQGPPVVCYQARLRMHYLSFSPLHRITLPQVPLRRPDGDVELVDAGVGFQLASCTACGSEMLKPDVVFFGDSVPKDRVER